MWWLEYFAQALRLPGLTICVAYCACMCVAGASLCSYSSAPGLRWFLETRVVWVCWVRGAGNLTTLNVKSKERGVLGEAKDQDP